MNTLKIIEQDGSECVAEVDGDVRFSPGRAGLGDCKATVAFSDTSGNGRILYVGDIFVMNAHGQTIARYTLTEQLQGTRAA